jgi:hypothetical protein
LTAARDAASVAGVGEGGGPWLWCLLSALFLSQIFIVPGVAVSDLLLAGVAAGAVASALRLGRWPQWPGWATWLAAFWTWALLGGFLRWLRTPFGFSPLEFGKSLAKLTFYFAVCLLLAWALERVEAAELRELLLNLLAINACLAILLYAAMLLWPGLRFERYLPGSASTAYYFELRWFGDRSPESLLRQVFLRARGLSSEPSQLGYLQGTGLGFVLLAGRGLPRLGVRLGLVLASILLTFSLTAYGLLAAVTLLAAPRLLGAGAPRRRLLLGALAVLAGTLLLPPVARTLHHAVVVRGAALLQGRADSSARLRLVESWSMALRMARDSPILGAGLGNFEQGLAAVKADLPARELLGPETQGWNVLAHVLAVTGAVGLCLFLLFLAQLAPGRGSLAALFLLGCIVQGSFLAAPFWVYWVVFLRGGTRAGHCPQSAANKLAAEGPA